jgi:hypothetical protein
MKARQNQKTYVVGQEADILSPGLGPTADELVTWRQMPGDGAAHLLKLQRPDLC